ncbi:MAG: helix-turn-helix domain-containing protein [Candidatus Aminicenantes bacterium]|nr:helix-turn-helix domain-containing protein [Candidatus Aminicenantes bacterium]
MPKHLNGLGRVFTIQEIADIFNVSVLMIRKYCREGKLNCQKIGNNPAQIEGKKTKQNERLFATFAPIPFSPSFPWIITQYVIDKIIYIFYD